MNPSELAQLIDSQIKNNTERIYEKTFLRGMVTAVSGRRISVKIEGNTTARPNILCLQSYLNPTINDKVLILSIGETGANYVALGKLDEVIGATPVPVGIDVPTMNPTIGGSWTVLPSSTITVTLTVASYFQVTWGAKFQVNSNDTQSLAIDINGTRQIPSCDFTNPFNGSLQPDISRSHRFSLPVGTHTIRLQVFCTTANNCVAHLPYMWGILYPQ